MAPVPAGLVLAQAAIESAWGTSHFAREDNNLFGQHAAADDPDSVAATGDSKVRLKRFDSWRASVAAYLHNLNTNPAYRGLRRERQKSRDSRALAAALADYSELGEDYVSLVKEVIAENGFTDYDRPTDS